MRSVPSWFCSADERRCDMHGVQCGILRFVHGRNGVHFLPRFNQRRRDELRNKRYLRRGHVHGRLDLRLVQCRDVLGRRRGKLHELHYGYLSICHNAKLMR